MRTNLIFLCLAASLAVAQTSGPFQPRAVYVVHSATRIQPTTPDTGLVPGSLCDINVTGLYQPSGNLLPGDMVTLRFRAPGATSAQDLTILEATASFGGTPTAFTALVPTGIPSGQGELMAVSSSGVTFSTGVWITATDFGIFTKAGSGSDAALAQVWRPQPLTVGLTTPVQAGEWITLWGTGLGSVDAASISVEVAGVSVAPVYAGAAPGLPGVDQINFQFPAGVPDDCYVPIDVKVAGRAGNTPSIAAAGAPGACHHRLGLSAAALETLDQGGHVPVSESWVYSDVTATPNDPTRYSRNDAVSIDFIQYDAAGVQRITGLLATPATGCQLNQNGLAGVIVNVLPLDAGKPVVKSPGGITTAMQGSFGYYITPASNATYTLDEVPPSSFAPGDWSVEAPGGKDIAAFQAALRVPPALHWRNRNTLSPVSRTNDLTLLWNPTGYTEQEWVRGSVGVGTASVICQTPATAGSVTIPASLISQLPAGATGMAMVELLLTPQQNSPSVYTVPLVGGGSFPGVANFSYLEMIWAAIH
ncbi:MAG TPA: hypothetical protein VG675_18870 [Bryobacteraceae bacterium]|nr:hypothetical protein [Bryobacteraceae bacterium]